MVLDVPTPDHIPLLVSAFDESPFYSRICSKREEDREEYLVHAIFHLCGDEVLEDSRYKQFMNRFSDEAHVGGRTIFPHSIANSADFSAYHIFKEAFPESDHLHERRLQPASAESARFGNVPRSQVQCEARN